MRKRKGSEEERRENNYWIISCWEQLDYWVGRRSLMFVNGSVTHHQTLTVTQIRFVDQLILIFRVVKGWPTASGFVLAGRGEQLIPTDYACIHAIIFQFQVLARKWAVEECEKKNRR